MTTQNYVLDSTLSEDMNIDLYNAQSAYSQHPMQVKFTTISPPYDTKRDEYIEKYLAFKRVLIKYRKHFLGKHLVASIEFGHHERIHFHLVYIQLDHPDVHHAFVNEFRFKKWNVLVVDGLPKEGLKYLLKEIQIPYKGIDKFVTQSLIDDWTYDYLQTRKEIISRISPLDWKCVVAPTPKCFTKDDSDWSEGCHSP